MARYVADKILSTTYKILNFRKCLKFKVEASKIKTVKTPSKKLKLMKHEKDIGHAPYLNSILIGH